MKPIFFLLLLSGIFPVFILAQIPDTIARRADTLAVSPANDSLKLPRQQDSLQKAREEGYKLASKLLNTDGQPISLAVSNKHGNSKDALFYLVALLVFALAFLKYFFDRYFINLFRVFFNTSIRQNQITDQLLQAKLPSFLFNIFFIISGGIYIGLLITNRSFVSTGKQWMVIFTSVAMMAIVYFIKYCTLKFTGWLTGLQEVTAIYTFVIFLVNKILGIFLVPFIIMLAFSANSLAEVATLVSIISIGIFLLLRFYQSYGLVQNQLKISKFHFILYIISLELLPLMLIYKGLMIYLTKIT